MSGQGIVCSKHTRCLGSLCEQAMGERGYGWEQEGIRLPPVRSFLTTGAPRAEVLSPSAEGRR